MRRLYVQFVCKTITISLPLIEGKLQYSRLPPALFLPPATRLPPPFPTFFVLALMRGLLLITPPRMSLSLSVCPPPSPPINS